ncbi:MAG: DUF3047 domain-containing protein [Pseudohongiella sp.]|nr:DUF3047 domain-containing protein [Pseudohongiella sp.]MDO9522045.1 DUF3047 domain-containing protein [Pseudohongiella sp.]MDP2128680.1 DUF3047 domain-containing protein [Pseudohongiella sp.]
MPVIYRRLSAAILTATLVAIDAGASRASAQSLDVSDFERWDSRSFSGATNYRIQRDDNHVILFADAPGTASAFYRSGRIDLTTTPCLSWSWKIDATAPAYLDERAKSGDDYAARVYVVRRGGLAFWRAKTINYVWSANQPAGSRWPNAYAGNNAQMWALDSGPDLTDQWQSHQRDIMADWQQAFGEQINSLDGIAIMTDGDDSGSQLSAAYATLRFSARNHQGQCASGPM